MVIVKKNLVKVFIKSFVSSYFQINANFVYSTYKGDYNSSLKRNKILINIFYNIANP